jgi:hypothetical protein
MMYGFTIGGATTFFHLAAKNPAAAIIVLAVGLSGLGGHVSANPGPGDRYGTSSILNAAGDRLVREHPELVAKVAEVRQRFQALKNTEPNEEQVRKVLRVTDAATDARVRDVMADPERRKEAAWLIYLDVYGREGPQAAAKLFPSRASPSPPPKR